MGTHTSLDEVRSAPSILDGIGLADELTIAASRDGGPRAVRLLAHAAVDPVDQLTAIAAVHSLAQVFDETADDVLVSLLSHDAVFLREHAAWAFGARLPRFDAIAGLISMTIDGGFAGMIAQRTLEQWGASAPEHVALAIEGAIIGVTNPAVRTRLVETIGLVHGRIPERMLIGIAADPTEITDARAAAIAAIGDRAPTSTLVRFVADLAAAGGELAPVAQLALHDLTAPAHTRAPWSQGLTVAQLFLHADIDAELSQVGAGDNGGIATLLVRLGDALVVEGQSADGRSVEGHRAARASQQIERVLTLSRGTAEGALRCISEVGATISGHAFATVPFQGAPPSMPEAWTARVATERGIRRMLKAAGTVDAIHLRMADVGSLAASKVARELGIPVVFTVAPDPHSVIRTLEASGALTRARFGEVDATEHFWFRARLVQRLAADAAHTVLFPRPELAADMRELVGIDITAHPERHSIVAEGIDISVIEQARSEALAERHVGDSTPGAAFAELDELLAGLPEHRRSLPLAVSVGRLHRIKGTAALVRAWATNDALRESCNLLIVGGDLDAPSAEEASQLALIDGVISLADAASHGLLLPGHRGNDTVARWLAAARVGRPGLAAARGVYVCASIKEEFGIAILEAMASGLTVVAPASGGPATYVEHGVTGMLVDTCDDAALAQGIADALAIAAADSDERNAERAVTMVAETFTIQAMAATLSRVYAAVAIADDEADESLSWVLANS